jgi:hypothetical protein
MRSLISPHWFTFPIWASNTSRQPSVGAGTLRGLDHEVAPREVLPIDPGRHLLGIIGADLGEHRKAGPGHGVGHVPLVTSGAAQLWEVGGVWDDFGGQNVGQLHTCLRAGQHAARRQLPQAANDRSVVPFEMDDFGEVLGVV